MGLVIGTAGWAIPKAHAGRFPATGTGLERYSAVFGGAEINSTFKHAHRPSTYQRWAASVPEDFRFSVKLPKAITHDQHLIGAEAQLAWFFDEIGVLGQKLGPILVQLPPSAQFDNDVAGRFFALLRQEVTGHIVCEARHHSWFGAEADALLRSYRIARVIAHPAPVEMASPPTGVEPLYLRLHGSPRVYYSSYDEQALNSFAAIVKRSANEDIWCIFDNTASGAAAGDALRLRERIGA